VAAHDDPRNDGDEAPTNPSADEAALLHELSEALTALGNYLAAAQREFEVYPGPMQEVLAEALRGGLTQYERAAEAVRQLRGRLFRDGRNDDRQGVD
jgi:hypothetical protein